MAAVVAKHRVPIVLMHNWLQGQRPEKADDVLTTLLDELRAQIDTALAAGIPQTQLLIDPGIGFGKSQEQNLELIARLDLISEAFPDLPVLIGTSRKSFIGRVLADDAGTPLLKRELWNFCCAVHVMVSGGSPC